MLCVMNLMLLLVVQSGYAGESGFPKDEKIAANSESVVVLSQKRVNPTNHFLKALDHMYRAVDDSQFKDWAQVARYAIETVPSVLGAKTLHTVSINGKPSSFTCSLLQAAV